MPSTKAAVAYKRKDGSLTVADDKKHLFWIPSEPPGSAPTVTITVADITNLQQTPASAPKVALKVFVKEDSYVFSFTSKENARREQEIVTDTLRDTIAASKASTAAQLLPSGGNTPAAGTNGEGQSAAMAIAKAVSSKAADDAWYDDNRLKSDLQLQRSLLESSKNLNDRFKQSLQDKPESVSIAQFTAQFWSTRLHLLRSHAIEKTQKQGDYNVLPEIKYTVKQGEEGQPDIRTLNITKEQIKLIFKQYPVVSRAYNENCPPLDAGQFWQRFFGSRLLKKLKGVPYNTRDDPPDPVLDKYLDQPESGPAAIPHIPRFIDLEGNEQNHSQRKGNAPDVEMRESTYDRPILHVLNSLSEKMLLNVAPEDSEAHAPIGMDEATFDELQLRDLAMQDVDNRVTLNVKEQQRYVTAQGDDMSADAKRYAKQDPDKVLSTLLSDLQPSNLGADPSGTLHLGISVHFDSDSDSDDPDTQTNGHETIKRKRTSRARPGTRRAMTQATTSILTSISAHKTTLQNDPHSLRGLSQSQFDTLTITYNTTNEFLHYFWTLFLSGDSTKVNELSQLITTLERSLDRINAVADAAETERQEKISKARTQFDEYFKKTGKRRKLDESKVLGGRGVVMEMVRPTVEALRVAIERYRAAYEEQSAEVAAASGG